MHDLPATVLGFELRTNLVDRLLDMAFGRGQFSEPTQFQVTTAARMLDKSLTAWDAALQEFASHCATQGSMPAALQPPGSFAGLSFWLERDGIIHLGTGNGAARPVGRQALTHMLDQHAANLGSRSGESNHGRRTPRSAC